MAEAPRSSNKLNASFCAENANFFKSSELNETSSLLLENPKEFSMTNLQQMNLIGYYYHGYVPLHIVSGGLALRFGFKNFLMITSLIAAVLTMAFPLLIRASYTYGLISRILLGAFHSGWFPAMQGAWGVWSPKEEASQLLMTIFVGATVGVTTVTSLGGVIVEQYGWPSIFYCSGGLTLIWAVFWYFLVFDSPLKHPTISDEGTDFECDIRYAA